MSFSSAVNPRTWTEYLAERREGHIHRRKIISQVARRGERDRRPGLTLGNLLGQLDGLDNLVHSRDDRALDGGVVLGAERENKEVSGVSWQVGSRKDDAGSEAN